MQNSGPQVINGVVIGGDSTEQGNTQNQTPQTNTTPLPSASGTPQQNTAPQVNGSGTTSGTQEGQNQSPQTGTPNAAGQSGVFNAPSQAPIVNGG